MVGVSTVPPASIPQGQSKADGRKGRHKRHGSLYQGIVRLISGTFGKSSSLRPAGSLLLGGKQGSGVLPSPSAVREDTSITIEIPGSLIAQQVGALLPTKDLTNGPKGHPHGLLCCFAPY